MTVTYDLTTPIGQIRLNTFGDDTDNPIFQDEELTAFYTQEQSRVKLACARVLNVVASRQAYILKVITNMGLTTNGAALAAEFRAQAAQLRKEDAEDQMTATDDDTGFAIAEWAVDDNAFSDIVWNERIRNP